MTIDDPAGHAAEAASAGAPRPLEGIRILDLTRVLAGPLGTMILGDLGATVVKVERPGAGDDLRAWGPPWSADGMSAYFIAVNRNKRSITLDLKQERGRTILRGLVRDADVVVENYRPGTLDELGIGYDALVTENAQLVYARLTAYGSSGPYRDLPGYDIVIQAMGGLMSVTGEPDGRPMRVGIAAVDILAGLYVAIGIMAALRERDRTGSPQLVELSLLGVELASLVNVVHNYLIAGKLPERLGNAHPSIVPYEVFATSDGHLALAVATEDQWRRFAAAIDRPDLAEDARFARNPDRVTNRDALMAAIEPAIAGRPTDAWIECLRAADIPCGPVNTVDRILADPQVVASGLIREIDRPGGAVRVVGNPLSFSGGPLQAAPPPALGAHTADELARIGIDPAQLDELRSDGVV